MVFKIPAPAARLKKNQFIFELDGTTESLPKMEFMTPEGEDYLAEIADKSMQSRDYILGLVEAIDPDLGKRLREARLARDQLKAFYDAWLESSKVDPGESSASDGT